MKTILTLLFCAIAFPAAAQDVLTLDSCRAMALRNNKEILISKAQIDKAYNDRRAAHTNYLPKVALAAGYLRTGDEISLLSKDQKSQLSALGTNAAAGFQAAAGEIVQQMPELGPLVESLGTSLVPALNGVGQKFVDALNTDTRNLFAGSVMLTQPLYMGGKIRAYNQITRYAEDVAASSCAPTSRKSSSASTRPIGRSSRSVPSRNWPARTSNCSGTSTPTCRR